MRLATSQIALLAVLASALSGCTDTFARFEAFEERVPDAAPPEPEPDAEPLATIPDISGTFLVALSAVIAPEPPFQFLAEIEVSGNMVDISLVGLHRDTRTPVEMDPLVATDVPVDETGRFEAPLKGKIAGEANPISGSELDVDVVMIGRIKNEDMFCGDATGKILKPVQLDITGSTIGAIRVEPGLVGDQLPAPLPACPEGE